LIFRYWTSWRSGKRERINAWREDETMADQDFNPTQQAMVETWERHMVAEFKT